MLKPGVVIIGFLFSLVLCPVMATPIETSLSGIVVEPGTPEDLLVGEELEMVEVPFWQLPPRHMLVVILVSSCPVLLFPLELLFLLKVFTYLGFRKVAQKNILDNPSRSMVYNFIRNNPGVDFTEISRKTGIGPGSLRYHLTLLKFMNKITILATTRNTRYYENTGRYSVIEQKVLRFLHNEPARNILGLLMKNPDMTRTGLEQTLGISGAGVNWHLHRLSNEGLLEISKDGRKARYLLNPEVVPYLEKYMPENRGLVVSSGAILAESVS